MPEERPGDEGPPEASFSELRDALPWRVLSPTPLHRGSSLIAIPPFVLKEESSAEESSNKSAGEDDIPWKLIFEEHPTTFNPEHVQEVCLPFLLPQFPPPFFLKNANF